MTQESDDDIIREMLPAFLEEANEQSDALEQLMLELEADPGNQALLGALFRCAHTIKGSAGVFGLDRVVGFTHHVETLLDLMREGTIVLTPELSTLLLQSNDVIRMLVQGVHDDQIVAPQDLVLRLQQAAHMAPHSDTGQQDGSAKSVIEVFANSTTTGSVSWRVEVRFGVDTFRHGIDPLTLIAYVRSLGHIPDIVCDTPSVPTLDAIDPESCHLGLVFTLDTEASLEEITDAFKFAREDCELIITPERVHAASDAPPATQASQAAAPAARHQRTGATGGATGAGDDGGFIRVQADRLDDVINLLGELVIAGSGASALARQTQQRALMEANRHVTRLIEGIRNSTLKLRMVPIGDTFARFRRVVRDTAAELGKEVSLEIVGGETELDKAMVERIADPLMHLVRNALDHGLETAAQRQAAGKGPQGKLTLSACHEAGNVLIRIMDDGRGVQRDKVLQRAWDRGLITRGAVPSDAEILNLIFAPGFSTAEQVTNLSGRGVGMDVVRSNVEALRGSVTIASDTGQGSCIEIRLPLTLAIIDGFLVGVGQSKFILPLDSVAEVIANRSTEATFDSHGRSYFELRGQFLPLVNLRTLYALDAPPPKLSSVVVVRAGAHRYGVLVDALLGQHQTVIKPLGLMLRSLRGVSGSSILGTGEVALIFDTTSLGQLAANPQAMPSPPKLSVGATSPIDTPHLSERHP
jgi:two-component system, chemotaxis family, sensor kinase CheA